MSKTKKPAKRVRMPSRKELIAYLKGEHACSEGYQWFLKATRKKTLLQVLKESLADLKRCSTNDSMMPNEFFIWFLDGITPYGKDCIVQPYEKSGSEFRAPSIQRIVMLLRKDMDRVKKRVARDYRDGNHY